MSEAHQVMLCMWGSMEAGAGVEKPVGRVSGANPLLDASGVHKASLVAGADAIDDDAARQHRNGDRKGGNVFTDPLNGCRDCLDRDRNEDSIVEVAGPEDLHK
jgi:hypothetical protein